MSSGAVFLAGGPECIPACVDIDRQILSSVTIPMAHVAFLPGASTPAERIRSGHVAESYFAELGVPCVVVDVDQRSESDRSKQEAAVAGASIIYFGGGDPDGLRERLRGTWLWQCIREAHQRGAAVGGSSAGAMVLCSHTLVRTNRTPGQPAWGAGLGLVEQVLLLPHFLSEEAETYRDFSRALARLVSPHLILIGLPERTALLTQISTRDNDHGDERAGTTHWRVVGEGPIITYSCGQMHAWQAESCIPPDTLPVPRCM